MVVAVRAGLDSVWAGSDLVGCVSALQHSHFTLNASWRAEASGNHPSNIFLPQQRGCKTTVLQSWRISLGHGQKEKWNLLRVFKRLLLFFFSSLSWWTNKIHFIDVQREKKSCTAHSLASSGNIKMHTTALTFTEKKKTKKASETWVEIKKGNISPAWTRVQRKIRRKKTEKRCNRWKSSSFTFSMTQIFCC